MADPLVECLIAKVRKAVGNPDLPVNIIVNDREGTTVIRAGGLDFPFRNDDIGHMQLWAVSFARMACVVAEGLKEHSRG